MVTQSERAVLQLSSMLRPKHQQNDYGGSGICVRFGSKADICGAKRHVRFTPESGHVRCTGPCLLWAN